MDKFYKQPENSTRVGQLFVFMGICNLGIATQKEIANFVLRDKASIQRTITDFVRNNLVRFYSDRNDRRKVVCVQFKVPPGVSGESICSFYYDTQKAKK